MSSERISERIVVLVCVGVLVGFVATTARADLIAHWPMDEGSGTTVADIVGGYNGTIAGNVTWAEGRFGYGLEFDGSSGSNVTIPFSEEIRVLNQGDFTLCAWVKADVVPTSEDKIIFVQKDANGPGRVWLFLQKSNDIRAALGGTQVSSGVGLEAGKWHHIAVAVIEGGDTDFLQLYVDGEQAGAPAQASMEDCGGAYLIGSHKNGALVWDGCIDDVAIFNHALTQEEVQRAMLGLGRREAATDPNPSNLADDISRDGTLSWTPGEFAATHDVYFGKDFGAVSTASRANPMGVLVSQGQTAATYSPPAPLEFSQSYFWRIDEVNAAPDYTIFPSEVWSFEVEPFTYQVVNITATSNGVSEEGLGPERTVDGSGLDPEDQHSTLDTDMWLAAPAAGEPLWIQYEFDRVYKLHEMYVWNYNVAIEKVIGFGLKDVTIAYSTDAVEWTTLGDIQFAQATTGKPAGYTQLVDFEGMAARYVRLLVNSGWGTLGQYGLSEVQFFQIPTFAREPMPADGESGVAVDAVLNWRAGREAVVHDVHFGTDEAAVAGGTALVDVVTENRYEPGELDVATTYYWRIDEVNEAEAVSAWQGDVWSFTTQELLIVDDFESYTDKEPSRIFDVWVDGWEDPTSNGSVVGNDKPPFAERQVIFGGRQSMNLTYDNSVAKFSEAERTWLAPQDWTGHGVDFLRLWLRGRPAPATVSYNASNGSYVVTGTGDGGRRDISGTADAFHFVHMRLMGNGSIIARIDKITGGGTLAKVGVMVRETLEPGAAHGMMSVTPANQVSFVGRETANGASTNVDGSPDAFTLPRWVRVTRTENVLRAEQSSDGVNWEGPTADPAQAEIGVWLPETVYIGLAFSSYAEGFAEATFSNVKTTGTVAPGGAFTTCEDIGIGTNTPQRLYVEIQDAAGRNAVATHMDNPEAVNQTIWMPSWDIPLSHFIAAGVDLVSVKKMRIGVGDRDVAASGGTGVIYIDEIQLGRMEPAKAPVETLIAHWPMDEGSGTTVADIVGGYNGTIAGNVTWAEGRFGYGLEFDGSSGSNVTIPFSEEIRVLNQGDFTLCAWVKADVVPTSEDKIIFVQKDANGPGRVWLFLQKSNDIRAALGGTQVSSGVGLEAGKWHHIAVAVIEGGDTDFLQLYVDGEQAGAPAQASMEDCGGAYLIGSHKNGALVWDGCIDDVAIFSRALTQGEIQAIMLGVPASP